MYMLVVKVFFVGWRREMVFVWEEKMVANVERVFLCIAEQFYVYIIFMNCLKLLVPEDVPFYINIVDTPF